MNELDLKNWDLRISQTSVALGIPPADVAALLQQIGIDKIEMLDDDEVFKFSDFATALNPRGIGIAKIRLAFKYLKGPGKHPAAPEGTPITHEKAELTVRAEQLRKMGFKTRIDDADTESLLKLYLPDKPNDPVTLALKKRFNDKPIIAFLDDGTVATEAVLAYVGALEQGYPPSDSIEWDGRLLKLWSVGVKPDQMVDEDPLFPGSPLRNDSSVVNHRSWRMVPQKERQMCRIILERGDIDPENKEAVLRLLERAEAGKLGSAYPEADLEFRERAKRDDLPKLKVQLGANSARKNDPFGTARKY